MSKRKLTSLAQVNIPDFLALDVMVENILDGIVDTNITDFVSKFGYKFNNPQRAVVLASYIALYSYIRPIKVITYAKLCTHLKKELPIDFEMAVMDKAEGSFLRHLYLNKFCTLEDIRKKIITDPSQQFFFIPELGVTKLVFQEHSFLCDDEIFNEVKKNDWKLLKQYLEYGYLKDSLEYAIKFDDIDLYIKLSHNDDYNPNFEIHENDFEDCDWQSISALSFAARYGSVKVFDHLLATGTNPDENLCELAVVGGNKAIITAALNMGGEFEESLLAATQFHRYDTYTWIYNTFKDAQMAPIQYALSYGNWIVFLFLFANGFDPGDADDQIGTALHWAAYWGIPEVVRICATNGHVHLRGRDELNRSALGWAAHEGQIEAAEVLLELCPSLLNDGPMTPLMEAAESGHLELARMLLDRGADVSIEDDQGETALHHAAKSPDSRVAQLLISSGAAVDARSEFGTPLLTAIGHGHYQMVRLLLEHRADIHARNFRGNTALYLACSAGFLRIAKLLVANGADPNELTDKGNTALFGACKSGSEDIVRYLLGKGCDPTKKGYLGRTPMYYAESKAVRKALVEAGAVEKKRHHRKKRVSHKFLMKIMWSCLSVLAVALLFFVFN